MTVDVKIFKSVLGHELSLDALESLQNLRGGDWEG